MAYLVLAHFVLLNMRCPSVPQVMTVVFTSTSPMSQEMLGRGKVRTSRTLIVLEQRVCSRESVPLCVMYAHFQWFSPVFIWWKKSQQRPVTMYSSFGNSQNTQCHVQGVAEILQRKSRIPGLSRPTNGWKAHTNIVWKTHSAKNAVLTFHEGGSWTPPSSLRF